MTSLEGWSFTTKLHPRVKDLEYHGVKLEDQEFSSPVPSFLPRKASPEVADFSA